MAIQYHVNKNYNSVLTMLFGSYYINFIRKKHGYRDDIINSLNSFYIENGLDKNDNHKTDSGYYMPSVFVIDKLENRVSLFFSL